MCGIAGVISVTKEVDCTPGVLRAMARSLKHRGPDDSGEQLEKDFAFGHQRLSILDLSEKGRQPMERDDVVITFNGEIYNFKELRSELVKEGCTFTTETDTEVILYAYSKWGMSCVEKFNGMFAFALHDRRKKVTYLVRDRLGIKPLFYAPVEGNLIFGSEIKAILEYPKYTRGVHWKAISSYLSYRYVLGEETFFTGVKKVLPGHYLSVSGRKVSSHCYWDIPLPDIEDLGIEYYTSKVRSLLEKSVQRRMISDVPLGAYLSGGLDSSAIVALMAQHADAAVKTYSISFKQKGYDELEYAEMVASKYKTDHRPVTLDSKKYVASMEELIRFKDEPLAVPNEVALFELSKVLKQDITVVLSGEGADEIFSGYGRIFRSPFDYVRMQKVPAMLRSFVFPRLVDEYRGRSFGSQVDHFLYKYSYFPWEEKKKLFTAEFASSLKEDAHLRSLFSNCFEKASGRSYYDQIAYTFEKLHLPGLLARSDTPTMATAVEARVPFVDHELVEFMFTVPAFHKMKWKSRSDFMKAFFLPSSLISEKHDITKYVLREALKDDLPAAILKRKKQGFPVPLDDWFRSGLIEYAKKLLLSDSAKISKVIDQGKLREWIEEHILGNDGSFGQRLWMLVNVELWLRAYF